MIEQLEAVAAPVTAGPLTAPEPVDLLALLRQRLRTVPREPLLLGRHADVALDAGDQQATIRIARGRISVVPGLPKHPATIIRASLPVLAGVAEGSTSGVGEFVAGNVTVRGDLSLAMALDGLFELPRGKAAEDVARRHPRATLIRVGGIPTAYLEAGQPDATPVVLLHGLGGTNASMLPLLWELAGDYRVLAPDLPGFGASGKPRARYDATWFADWLDGFCDALDADRAVLIGNSMGGRIAIEYALRRPDNVAALVLLSAAPAFRRMRQFVPIVRLLRPEAAVVPVPLPRAMVVETIKAMFSDPDRVPDYLIQAAADEFLRVWHDRGGRLAFLSCLRAIYLDPAYGSRGFWQRLPRLRPPALFLWGDRDRLVPASFARHVSEAVPEAGSVVLEDCGHVPQFEHPELVATMVRGFLCDVLELPLG